MRWTTVVAVTAAGGCAPPPLEGVAGGPPTIHLIYPAPGTDDVTADTDGKNAHMELDEDGVLRFVAAVAFENIEFVEPSGDSVPGQGHWHLFVGDKYTAPSALYEEAAFADLVPDSGGTVHTLKVRLQENDHSELSCLTSFECENADVEDSIEFTLDAFSPDTDTDDGT